jgi:flavodoxin/Fe-S-cluster-containing hydrogenase component 2
VKTLIICFSQSGNTRKIAECIRQGMIEETPHCRICDLRQAAGEDLAGYDLVGLGCPVFYYQEPFNVRDFLKALPEMPGKNWFLFCTHGTIIGNTFPSMTKQLQQKGVAVIGYHDTYADARLPFYPHPTYTTGHPDRQDLDEARLFGSRVVRRCREVISGKAEARTELGPIPDEWLKNAQMFTSAKMAEIFPPLRLKPDLCTLCRECEQDCPVNGIDLNANPPRLQKPCIYCWRCVNICPEAAIQADWGQQVKLAPKLYRRYRYWLDQAAAQGKFRWLVDPESIDFDNPYHLQDKKQR